MKDRWVEGYYDEIHINLKRDPKDLLRYFWPRSGRSVPTRGRNTELYWLDGYPSLENDGVTLCLGCNHGYLQGSFSSDNYNRGDYTICEIPYFKY